MTTSTNPIDPIDDLVNDYEVALVTCGLDAANVDYDKLADVRTNHKAKLNQLIAKQVAKQVLENRMDEIATIPVEHGRYTTSTYVNGKQQTIQERYDELEQQLRSKHE